ncbi:MAG: DUF3575 domain-containing protein [Chitinophagaceae bacterium]|nr:DUF3575 domain-containing protein [Chitinophagaceae bacterium]
MRILSLVIFTILAFSSFSVSAQDEKGTDKPARNIFKVNLPAIALRTYSFQYEFVVSKRISLAFGYRNMPNGSFPFQSSLLSLTGSNDQSTVDAIKDLKTGNTAYTPELRFYLSKKGYGRGFYVAPFFRAATYNASQINVAFSNGAGGTLTIPIEGSIKTNTFGFLLGSQWSLSKWVSFDWWIIGPQYGSGSGSLSGVSPQTLNAQAQADLTKELNNISIPYATKKVTVTANSAKMDIDGPWAGVRAGLALGVKF